MNVIEEAELLKGIFIGLLIATRIAENKGYKSVLMPVMIVNKAVTSKPVEAPMFMQFYLL